MLDVLARLAGLTRHEMFKRGISSLSQDLLQRVALERSRQCLGVINIGSWSFSMNRLAAKNFKAPENM
jgi:hypothetical protein